MENKPSSEPAEFDAHASDYEAKVQASLPESFAEGDYFSRYKVCAVAASQKGKTPQTILDFGCGVGLALQLFSEFFPKANLWGYDLSPASLEQARQRVSSAELTASVGDLRDGFFDIIFIANVFHHVPRDERLLVMKTCAKLLKRGGQIYVFEHNPYNPVTRRVFERCPFDKGAQMLPPHRVRELGASAGLSIVTGRYTLFFPKQLAMFRPLEAMLGWLPLGAQYYVEMTK